MAKRCKTGKVRHTSLVHAEVAAHAFARFLNQNGRLVQSMYAYECPRCRGWHLTRQDRTATLVHIAAPIWLQHWAMSGEDLR